MQLTSCPALKCYANVTNDASSEVNFLISYNEISRRYRNIRCAYREEYWFTKSWCGGVAQKYILRLHALLFKIGWQIRRFWNGGMRYVLSRSRTVKWLSSKSSWSVAFESFLVLNGSNAKSMKYMKLLTCYLWFIPWSCHKNIALLCEWDGKFIAVLRRLRSPLNRFK